MAENKALMEILKEKGAKQAKAEVLNLEVGDNLHGELLAVDESTKFGKNWCYTVKDDSGDNQVIFGNPVMNGGMAGAKIGDWVAIERIEDKPTDKGNPLKQYNVYIKPKDDNEETKEDKDKK